MDSQIGCDNVVKQHCCITKLQTTYNLKLKIVLNFRNVRSFKYQLNFFTLDFFKGYSWPPSLYFPVVTILCYIFFFCSKFPSSSGDGTVEGLYLCCLVSLHQNTTQGHFYDLVDLQTYLSRLKRIYHVDGLGKRCFCFEIVSIPILTSLFCHIISNNRIALINIPYL